MIILLNGVPGAGKSTVAEILAGRFERGVKVSPDNIRGWVKGGSAFFDSEWNDEQARQFGLSREVAARAAQIYSAAGFDVVIDDCLFPPEVKAHFWMLDLVKILLRPNVEVAVARNSARVWGDFDFSVLNPIIRDCDLKFEGYGMAELGWHIVDNTHERAEETVGRIEQLLVGL